MALTNVSIDGAWTLQGTNTALEGRQHDGGFWAQANVQNSGLQPMQVWRSGVVHSSTNSGNPYDFIVAQTATPSLSLLVYPGTFVVSRASQAVYQGYNTAVQNVTVANADPTNPRLDLIVARVEDTGVGDGSTRAQIQVITGTPAASPVIPALPAGAVPLASARVNALATTITTANLTDLRKSAALNGAVRRLLPGDALSDVGFRDGELRDTGTTIDRWMDSSSSWVNVKVLGSTGCLYVNTGTDIQTFSTTTKLTYPTAFYTTSLVTASGTNNTDFAVNRTGWWTITAGGRWGNQNAEGYWVIRRGATEVKGHNYPARTFGIDTNSATLFATIGDTFNFALVPTASVTTTPVGELQSFSMKYLGD